MAFIKKIIETKTSNVPFWTDSDPSWEAYRKEVYQDTGKLEVKRQCYVANGDPCIVSSEECVRREMIFTFDTVESSNQLEADRKNFEVAERNLIAKDAYNSNNNITLAYESIKT
jgi:hypothetical protein